MTQIEPELYKLLFLTRPDNVTGGVMDALRFSRELARESIMTGPHGVQRAASGQSGAGKTGLKPERKT